MKNVTIRKFDHAEVDAPEETFGFLKIPLVHTLIRAQGEELEISDGYHTMDELYEHRIYLYISLCRAIAGLSLLGAARGVNKNLVIHVWRSQRHSDGDLCFGTGTQFVLGIHKEKGTQITYHIPISKWDETAFAETLERAPEFDGHTSQDVLERLKKL